MRWVSAEPQATIMSDPRWRGQIGGFGYPRRPQTRSRPTARRFAQPGQAAGRAQRAAVGARG